MGCAIAYNLARRGAQVLLLEKGRLADEQSSRAWGFVRQRDRDVAELPFMVQSNRLWQGLSAELEADLDWRQGGNLGLAGSQEEMAYFEQREALEKEHGVASQLLGATAVKKLLPGLGLSVQGGLHTPGDGHADPRKTTLAFAEAARRAGAQLEEYHPVEGLTLRDNRVASVRSGEDEVACQVLICAAGAHSARMCRMAGLDLPLRRTRATVAATRAIAPLTSLAVKGLGVSFRQEPGGAMILGRSGTGAADYDLTLESFRHLGWFLPNYLKNRDQIRLHLGKPLLKDLLRSLPGSRTKRYPFAHTVDMEPQANPSLAEENQQAFMAHFPHLGEVPVDRIWAGVIDTTPDAIPVLGAVPGLEGFILAAGFSGHGFGMAPVVGQVIADLVLDGRTDLDLHPLRYTRFAEGAQAAPRRIG